MVDRSCFFSFFCCSWHRLEISWRRHCKGTFSFRFHKYFMDGCQSMLLASFPNVHFSLGKRQTFDIMFSITWYTEEPAKISDHYTMKTTKGSDSWHGSSVTKKDEEGTSFSLQLCCKFATIWCNCQRPQSWKLQHIFGLNLLDSACLHVVGEVSVVVF